MQDSFRQGGREGRDGGRRRRVAPSEVHEVLGRHLLVDGFPLVLDTEKSRGSHLVDARDGAEYLDFYTFFASAPLGINPAGLADDADFVRELGALAANKPANSDIATTALAEFTETFSRVLGDPQLPHLFFIEGGAIAVENALKVAFDWKSRRNEAAGRPAELGSKVLHMTHAFHGRSGYTLSLTNTDPQKVDRFPKFDWPRIGSPAITFPLEENLAATVALEKEAVSQAEAAFARNEHDICCFIFEPIQAEGGDRHLRAEFLQEMQSLCLANDALFVADEVQTGAGVTGTPWCYEQLGLEPDVVAFGKKVQLGGIMGGRRVDEVADNVFKVPSRINSTWGGNLVDMVRSTRLLELVESGDAMANASARGEELLTDLQSIAAGSAAATNPRGRGLLAAIDVPDSAFRDEALARLRDEEHVLALSCGERSIRLRPSLAVSAEEVSACCEGLERVLARMEGAK